MKDHIALLEKEIKKLELNLARAKVRPGVTAQEITNLERNIQLKWETLVLVKVYGGVND